MASGRQPRDKLGRFASTNGVGGQVSAKQAASVGLGGYSPAQATKILAKDGFVNTPGGIKHVSQLRGSPSRGGMTAKQKATVKLQEKKMNAAKREVLKYDRQTFTTRKMSDHLKVLKLKAVAERKFHDAAKKLGIKDAKTPMYDGPLNARY